MLCLNKNPIDCFFPVYKEMVSSFHAGGNDIGMNSRSSLHVLEGTERLIKEELVRCIWFGQHLKRACLCTDNGSRLEILSPGWWNSEGGPDFKHAEFLLEGKGLVKGDIEVHVFSSDWIRHQHHKQSTYDTVCLHVALWNDNHGAYMKNHRGQTIPQLTLSKYLDAELDELVELIDVESYLKGKKVNPGYCQTEMENQKVNDQWIGRFLDYAGDERILQKAKRYERWLEKGTFEQVLYEAVMESLGYKNNKEPFFTLASRLPLEDIRYVIPEDASAQKKKKNMQSLLLGMAGLLPQQRNKKPTDDKETANYINDIEHAWNEIQKKINRDPLTKNDWSYAGIRPANFPERRIAAIANILSECSSLSIFRYLLSVLEKVENYQEERKIIKRLVEDIQSIFLGISDSYWSYHYTWYGKKLAKPVKLLGKERASNIFINVIIPILLIYARKHSNTKIEKVLHLTYRNYTPLPDTSVTKFMGNRIFGQPNVSKKIINSVRRQQGLYQIFKDFCENDNMSCNKCALYLSMVKD
ncbi:MAG: DUF2851 family protein [Candidatus Brocadia sp. AMX2]|uniref:DUF2851 family protein n=1 Tax=Candidatus Brocadia sinica JPN1 TaxID=1197129 RepID=A0ABQ0JUG5_9BACT|nr:MULTISPECIES: DUF2851 family protein [Brocadia]KXK29894.1 MAG: hypothetical protein UZ01_01870 [Candidatus Brocadia sinica]MBC6932957.1 DUF2851 family protein [Candidatus Brocadia sp.]MBL1169263.1 DUF2851 family protein [Candidatus Brocadia sp. AMX1]NOG41763.1 DUF2851 family protein [Planctomycetota bacterium]KAA0241903.1 MAG: DUF2851 family protein [Candidatus Brocadia sp. AMX2]